MEKRLKPPEEFLSDRKLLEFFIHEHRTATEELRLRNRELEIMLEELLATRPDLQTAYDEVDIGEEAPGRPEVLQLPEASRELRQLKAEALRVVQKGREVVRQSTLLRLRAKRLRTAARKPPSRRTKADEFLVLSKREHEVLRLIVAGKTSKEIAANLGISFKTAVTHRASIMGKLDVHEIASMVREAIRRGLV